MPSFGLPVDLDAGTPSGAPVAADFNGDGRIDLANGDGNAIRVLLGNGDGTFQPPRTSNAGLATGPVLAADLNGDGRTDLVTTKYSELSVVLGNGDGTFQPPLSLVLPAGQDPSFCVSVGEFNGDGHLDLVAGGQIGYSDPETGYGYYDYYVNVLPGHGDGTFGPATASPLADRDFALGDFNGDSRLDVVLTGFVLLGNGDGTLQDLRPSDVGVGGILNPVGDFDRDGKLDVLWNNAGGAIVYLGNGDGTFRRGASMGLSTVWHYPIVGDVNADSRLDIVVMRNEVDDFGSYDPVTIRSVQVWLGHGDGTFTEPAISDFGAVPGIAGFVAPVLADFDGDGFPELAASEDYAEDYYTQRVTRGVHVAHNDGLWAFPPPTITVSDASVAEGNTGAREARFTVTLSATYGQPVTVNFSTANGTAAASDYQASSGMLIIPAGQRTATVAVLVNGDRLAEPDETFFVNLSNPNYGVIADGQAQGTIVDDEPRTSISDVSKVEGKPRNTTLFTFTVTLAAAYDQAVTMSFRTANGAATTGDGDYVGKTGTLTFAPGETTKTITIEVKGDSKTEANETFYLDLFGNSSNSLFAKNRGIGTILNDD